METNEIELYKLCWNKYSEIHTQKIEYLKKIYNILNNLKDYLSDFQKNYNSLEMDKLIFPIVDDQFNDLVKHINKSIKTFLQNNLRMIQSILSGFKEKDIINIIKSEKNIYEKVVIEQKKYLEKKEKMNKLREHFNEKMWKIEDKIKDKIKKKKVNISIDSKKLNEAIKDFNEFKYNLEDYNKTRESFNRDQKALLEDHQKIILLNEAELFELVKKNFISSLKIENENSKFVLEKYQTTKKSKDSKKDKIEDKWKYIKELTKNYKSDEIPDKALKLLDYHLKHKGYLADPDTTPEEIDQTADLSDQIIKIFRKAIKDNYSDCPLQIQEAELEIPEKYQQFFNFQVEVTEDLKNKLISLLKQDLSLYRQILIELGKYRANGKLFASEAHIQLIETLLIEILKISEQKEDYRSAKDCILLSQTYYVTEKETNKKIYAFEKIKKFKWVLSIKFWRNFLDKFINVGFEKYEEMNSMEIKLKNNPKLSDKKKEKVREILFSCIVPYLKNMIELKIDKRLILKLIDEINDKYKYLNDEYIQNLESFLSTSQEEIEKMRKEYKENQNLEEELENLKDNDDINNDSNSNSNEEDNNNDNKDIEIEGENEINLDENVKNEIKEE